MGPINFISIGFDVEIFVFVYKSYNCIGKVPRKRFFQVYVTPSLGRADGRREGEGGRGEGARAQGIFDIRVFSYYGPRKQAIS